MPHSVVFDRQAALAEARMLHNVKPLGPVIGLYADAPIHEHIRDDAGRKYGYAGVACQTRRGQYDCTQLATGEFVVPPGIIYREVDTGDAGRRTDRQPLIRSLAGS
jgi:hypothetical protein